LVYGNPNFQTNKPTEADANSVLFRANNKSFTLNHIEASNKEFRSRNGVSDSDNIMVIGDSNSPATFAFGLYNAISHGNYVILGGGEKISSLAEKIPYQDAGIVVINQKITQDDLTHIVAKDTAPKLKNILVSGNEEKRATELFGGRQVTAYNPYFA